LPEGAELEDLLGRPVLATVPTLEFIEPRRRRSRLSRPRQRAQRDVDRDLRRSTSLTQRLGAAGAKQREPAGLQGQSAPKSERARP
jgi:hypothetical protein